MQSMNIEIEEKTDYTLSITYRDDTTNFPVDLTNYSAHLQVRSVVGNYIVLLELTNGSGITLGGVTGSIDISFTPEMTDSYLLPNPWTRGMYDLVLTTPDNKKIKILKGFITIVRSVTI